MEAAKAPAERLFNWLPPLLYCYTFFTVIFLVNLLIAKMSSTYEKIRAEALYYRLYNKVR